MGDFKKLNVKIYEKKSEYTSPDVLYWKQFSAPVFIKEFGPIDFIDFSPKEPHYFAVTSSVRVQVYSPVTRLLYKNLSRFQKSAFGGAFRSDGKLLCSGGEECAVKLFDVGTKSLLRVFKGHTGPVHRCFFTNDNNKIASFSDDGSVGLWDIPSEKRLFTFNEHTDYIRAGAVSPVCPYTILSGGYDNVVKMYDARSDKTVFTVKHEAPVESVLFLPSGGIFISAGGTEIKVWDAFAGGRLLTRICQHHKTVTSLRIASNGTRLLSGALDRHVNIYDVGTFNRLHSHTYPNSVLSLGLSANDDTLAVGMVDGLVSVRRRESESKITRPTRPSGSKQISDHRSASRADIQIGSDFFNKTSRPDFLLRKFEHTKALNSVLKPYIVNKTPHVTATMLRELLARQKLHSAVAGCEPRTVLPLLRFLIKYIGDIRFTRLLIRVSEVFLDAYEDCITDCGASAVALFKRLDARVQEEVQLTKDLMSLQGAINLLLSASNADGPMDESASQHNRLLPSAMAKGFVVNVS